MTLDASAFLSCVGDCAGDVQALVGAAVALVFLWEHLLASSALKSNSTIQLVVAGARWLAAKGRKMPPAALVLLLALGGCAHSPEARAAEAGTIALDSAAGVRPKLADWIVMRSGAAPVEAASACSSSPPPAFVACFDRELAARMGPVSKAKAAHQGYVDALALGVAAHRMDVIAAASVLLEVARSLGVLP